LEIAPNTQVYCAFTVINNTIFVGIIRRTRVQLDVAIIKVRWQCFKKETLNNPGA
jgi:hypothetical protein